MRHFDYQKVSTLGDALEATAAVKGTSLYLAGGTDLLVRIKEGRAKPERVIDLKGIPGLQGIEVSDKECIIGALTTIRTLETSSALREKAPLLARAASKLGSVQVRNRATIGGNLCNAAPSAETAPALLALDARAEIQGPEGKRAIDLRDFFLGPGETVLKEGECLTALKIPLGQKRQGAVYTKLTTRKAMDIAFVGVAVLLEVDEAGSIDKARIGLGAVAPTPIRSPSAERVLEGKALTPDIAGKAGDLAAQEARPISDLRASADYRREMVNRLCRRGLIEAYQQAISQEEGREQ